MAQEGNYYFDPETCSFVEVEPSYTQYAKRAGLVLALALVLAGGMLWVMDVYWVGTPEKLALRSENEALREQLTHVNERMDELSEELDQLSEHDRELYRTLLQAEPISEDVRQVGIGGSDAYESYDQLDGAAASLLHETSSSLDQLERQMNLQNTSFRELAKQAEQREAYLQELPALIPADGPIVSGYGERMHPVLKVRKMHNGIDILVRPGTPVIAPADGVVRRVSSSPTLGEYVDLRHPESGYITRYAHLSEAAPGLQRGQRVERGDTIAYSGNSGRSTGPHLHYEVRNLEDKQAINPLYFFAPDMTPKRYEHLLVKAENLEVAPG